MSIHGELFILLGLPRAGKTTYSNVWMDETHNGLPRIVVNSDQVRLAMHTQRYCREAEPFVHAVTKLIVRMYYNMGYSLLIDETNTTVGSIRQWLEIDPEAEFHYIDTSPEECSKRARLTNQVDLIPVIDRMYDNLKKLANYDNKSGIDVYPCNKNIMYSVEKIRQEVKDANSRK